MSYALARESMIRSAIMVADGRAQQPLGRVLIGRGQQGAFDGLNAP